MLFDRLFRSLVPLQNPLGFGAGDFLELGLAVFLTLFALASRAWIEPLASKLAKHTGWCMLALAILPIALRLVLLPHHPAPSPEVAQEFNHFLAADTLRHGRLANPSHPLHQFFETQGEFQQPAYGSIYPIGQGAALALGRAIFGTPWAGALLSTAALSALCYWMLRAWVTPAWALVGGALAAIQFGPLSAWTNSYDGGALAAAAGCLVFGSLPRLEDQPFKPRNAVLLGLGFGIHLLIRPYESIFLLASVIFFLATHRLLKPALLATAAIVPALALMAFHNHALTGSFLTQPSTLSERQYGVPAALTIRSSPMPDRELTRQQESDYKMERSYRPAAGETLRTYLLRLEYRVRFYRFFFLPPLYLALPFFFPALREIRFAWVAFTLAAFALGSNLNPLFDTQDIAGITCLFILIAVIGLRRMNREAAWIVLALCAAHFTFWYGLHLFDTSSISRSLMPYETWDAIKHAGPSRRVTVNQMLAAQPGQQLVIVRYAPQHPFQDEWVYNEADIDAARVVWARDLGGDPGGEPEDENEKLLQYYPSRTAWLLEPDAQPPRLTPFQPAPQETPAQPASTQKSPLKPPQKSPFEEVK